MSASLRNRYGRWADISPDEQYRYLLGRQWDADRPTLWWVMHNPSTADALRDDRTITRVTAFSDLHGFGTAIVVNLFAYRATNPARLRSAVDPVGPRNDDVLAAVASTARTVAATRDVPTPIVCAWGANADPARAAAVVTGPLWGLDLRCLGRTRNGQPRHPLYVRGDTPLEPWSPT